ncbi:hypothetical protein K488DRAFT_87419 [Vararia minispora EC-137]|uniref:Uncharacterized protein n=1 Tax=Vararia minispora EC-137 TaxID=1314806 RepID=A0ACB8QGG1_9AGAM|nr:hypothetical protein K488DRAFT_87419 [Vararia minispora EC-137]
MSASVKPWIAAHLISIAEKHGAILNQARHEKNKLVQILKFIFYPTTNQTSGDCIWAEISDSEYRIPIRFTSFALQEFARSRGEDSQGRSLLDFRGGVVKIANFTPAFKYIPRDQKLGLTDNEFLIIEADKVSYYGAVGQPTFGSPQALYKHPVLAEWIVGLRQGNGNVLKNRKKQEQPTAMMIATSSSKHSSGPTVRDLLRSAAAQTQKSVTVGPDKATAHTWDEALKLSSSPQSPPPRSPPQQEQDPNDNATCREDQDMDEVQNSLLERPKTPDRWSPTQPSHPRLRSETPPLAANHSTAASHPSSTFPTGTPPQIDTQPPPPPSQPRTPFLSSSAELATSLLSRVIAEQTHPQKARSTSEGPPSSMGVVLVPNSDPSGTSQSQGCMREASTIAIRGSQLPGTLDPDDALTKRLLDSALQETPCKALEQPQPVPDDGKGKDKVVAQPQSSQIVEETPDVGYIKSFLAGSAPVMAAAESAVANQKRRHSVVPVSSPSEARPKKRSKLHESGVVSASSHAPTMSSQLSPAARRIVKVVNVVDKFASTKDTAVLMDRASYPILQADESPFYFTPNEKLEELLEAWEQSLTLGDSEVPLRDPRLLFLEF